MLFLFLPLTAGAQTSSSITRQIRAWGIPVVLEERGKTLFSGYVSTWRQDCAKTCGLPIALDKNIPVKLELEAGLKPGEVSSAKRHLTFAEFDLEVTFFAVCPRGPADCPGLYYQVQAQLSGDAEAFCGAALNRADAWPFPVLQCAGKTDAQGRRYGVTLHREVFTRFGRVTEDSPKVNLQGTRTNHLTTI